MNGPVILTLDIATRFGWCVGAVDGGSPEYGSGLFAAEGAGDDDIFAGAYKWTAITMQERKINRVRIEEPIDPRHMGKATNMSTTKRLLGIHGAVKAAVRHCKCYDIDYTGISTWRSSLALKGVKRGEWKEKVMWAMQARGFDVDDNNAADALAI